MSNQNKYNHIHTLHEIDSMQPVLSAEEFKNLILENIRKNLLTEGYKEEDAEVIVKSMGKAMHVSAPRRIS